MQQQIKQKQKHVIYKVKYRKQNYQFVKPCIFNTTSRCSKNMTFEKPQKSTSAQKALTNRDILLIYIVILANNQQLYTENPPKTKSRD